MHSGEKKSIKIKIYGREINLTIKQKLTKILLVSLKWIKSHKFCVNSEAHEHHDSAFLNDLQKVPATVMDLTFMIRSRRKFSSLEKNMRANLVFVREDKDQDLCK